MDLGMWMPDGPAGWIVLAALVAALGWLAARKLPGRMFGLTAAKRLATQRGWLVKISPGAGAGGSGWDAGTVPGTYLEFLGEHQGLVMHAGERRIRTTTSAGTPGEPRRYWRHDYVITVAATPASGQGQLLAVYPAIQQWEQGIFDELNSGMRPRSGWVRNGDGMFSTGRRGHRLSKKQLLADLDRLAALARSR
ncbi:hypothetical protein [Prauserella cavernicola]|uniref:Uncharacterized protein n=1 Tax=Prauserella cavernicola TaxID=2800127 RepID=A0A934QP32_9PSEU|nr:hypothetical protein [Prauserella cavernicola]MBK1784055.1 hypothetical protein [Prauserella cavernicola]